MKTRMILICLLGLLLLHPLAEAASPFVGYGDVRFGDLREAVQAKYPAVVKQDEEADVWECDLNDMPFLWSAKIRFTFMGNKLDNIRVSGHLVESGLGQALAEKYGEPTSAETIEGGFGGGSVTRIWEDANGTRLEYRWNKQVDSYINYNSIAKARRDSAKEAKAREKVRRKL